MCYTICGAIAFQAIETTEETEDLIDEVEHSKYDNTDLSKNTCQVTARRTAAVSELWNITNTYNTLNKR